MGLNVPIIEDALHPPVLFLSLLSIILDVWSMYASILRFGRINERVIFYRNWLALGSVRWYERDLEIPTHSLLTLYGYDDRLPISLFKPYFRWAVSHTGWRQCLATSDLTQQLRSSWASIVTTADLTRILSVGLCEKESLEISEV